LGAGLALFPLRSGGSTPEGDGGELRGDSLITASACLSFARDAGLAPFVSALRADPLPPQAREVARGAVTQSARRWGQAPEVDRVLPRLTHSRRCVACRTDSFRQADMMLSPLKKGARALMQAVRTYSAWTAIIAAVLLLAALSLF
jgi:hypothetical protein